MTAASRGPCHATAAPRESHDSHLPPRNLRARHNHCRGAHSPVLCEYSVQSTCIRDLVLVREILLDTAEPADGRFTCPSWPNPGPTAVRLSPEWLLDWPTCAAPHCPTPSRSARLRFPGFAHARPGARCGGGLWVPVWPAIDRKGSIGCWCPAPGASQIPRQAAGPEANHRKARVPSAQHQPHAGGRPSRQRVSTVPDYTWCQ